MTRPGPYKTTLSGYTDPPFVVALWPIRGRMKLVSMKREMIAPGSHTGPREKDVSKHKALLFDPVQSEYILLQTIPEWLPLPNNIRATKLWECADCRLQGGTNVVPPYWIY